MALKQLAKKLIPYTDDVVRYGDDVADAGHMAMSVRPLNYKTPTVDWHWDDYNPFPVETGIPPKITDGSDLTYAIRDLDVNYGFSPEDAIIRNTPIEQFPIHQHNGLFSTGHYQVVPKSVQPMYAGTKGRAKSGSSLRDFMEKNYPWKYNPIEENLPF
jgi:hypothetical protein